MSSQMPPANVLVAFGAGSDAVLLPGGQGRTWLAGNMIIKPCGLPAETAWVAEVVSALAPASTFRVPKPMRQVDGSWTAFGWEAWQAVPGEPDVRRWDDVLAAAEAFHSALAGMPRPRFLNTRDDPWSYGDRVAWAELPLNSHGVMAGLLRALALARLPIDLPAQPVHGDLLGNVLFADGLPPAIIDWPVYFRPASWALAVAVVDALTWHQAPGTLIDRLSYHDEWDQMLIRALMFRIATNEGCRRQGIPVRESTENYQPVAGLVLSRARAAFSQSPASG